MKRVTLSDVAKEAGVHHSTVSRALKNHPGIPARTRNKILTVVRRLRYVPDPHLSALAAYKNSHRPAGFLANLAWVTNFSSEEGWRENPQYSDYFQGAKERAAEVGYGLDTIWLPGIKATGKAPSQILRHRSIRGLLLPPQPAPQTSLKLDWDDFSAVAFGFTLSQPALHTVSIDNFRSVQKLVRELHRLGYRRPRLILVPGKTDERASFAWSAGFHVGLQQVGLPTVEPIRLPSLEVRIFTEAAKRSDADVILTTRRLATLARKHFPSDGLSIPQSVGLAALNFASCDQGQGGIREDGALLGRHAVDMLIAMLQRGEKGVPVNVQHLFTEGSFFQGETLRHVADQ